MQDGMSSEQVSVGEVKGGSIIASVVLSGADFVVAATKVGAAEMKSNSITATQIAADAVGTSEQGFCGAGSPPAYVSRILHGNAIVSAATSDWVVFGDKFGSAPDVVVWGDVAGDVYLKSGDVAAGSFYAIGTANTSFMWVAMGSV